MSLETDKTVHKYEVAEMDSEGKFVGWVTEASEFKVPNEVQLRGILRALRHILDVPEAQSILLHATNIMRRYNRLKEKYPDG